jgi:hypothetical protein
MLGPMQRPTSSDGESHFDSSRQEDLIPRLRCSSERTCRGEGEVPEPNQHEQGGFQLAFEAKQWGSLMFWLDYRQMRRTIPKEFLESRWRRQVNYPSVTQKLHDDTVSSRQETSARFRRPRTARVVVLRCGGH